MPSPMSERMKLVLASVADAKSGSITGWALAKWLNQSCNPEGVRESLIGLVKRGLIDMHPKDCRPGDFPSLLNASYSIRKDSNG